MNKPKGELAIIPLNQQYSTYVQIFVLKADGVLISFNQRSNRERDGQKVELPSTAIAYRFFDAMSVSSSNRHNWRGRNMGTACNHSAIFGTDHQKICERLADKEMATVWQVKRELFLKGLLK